MNFGYDGVTTVITWFLYCLFFMEHFDTDVQQLSEDEDFQGDDERCTLDITLVANVIYPCDCQSSF